MVKDPKSGEIFRADHLVEEVLESRLKGDKEARGQKVEDKEEDPKKKKKKVKNIAAVKLDDAVVQEYEETLAKIDNYGGEELGLLMKKYDIKVCNSILPHVCLISLTRSRILLPVESYFLQ